MGIHFDGPLKGSATQLSSNNGVGSEGIHVVQDTERIVCPKVDVDVLFPNVFTHEEVWWYFRLSFYFMFSSADLTFCEWLLAGQLTFHTRNTGIWVEPFTTKGLYNLSGFTEIASQLWKYPKWLPELQDQFITIVIIAHLYSSSQRNLHSCSQQDHKRIERSSIALQKVTMPHPHHMLTNTYKF